MTGCDFSYRHYAEILRAARQRFAFTFFEDAPGRSGPFILLRHDVDFALEPALKLARIEAEAGVQATYFVLPHAHYNLLGPPSFAAVREIVGLGHRIGIHYDAAFYADGGLDPAQALVAEAALVGARFGTTIAVAAQHQPSRTPGAQACITPPLLDAYAPAFTSSIKYLSDSCQFWREGCLCRFVEAGQEERLQVLVHPVWWSGEGLPADRILDRWTDSRIAGALDTRGDVFRYYATLTHLGNRHLFDREDP